MHSFTLSTTYLPNLAARIFSLDNYNNSTKLLNDLTVSPILSIITYGIHSSYCLKDQLQSVIHLSLFLPLLSLIFSPFWPLAILPPFCFSNIPRVFQTQSFPPFACGVSSACKYIPQNSYDLQLHVIQISVQMLHP